MADLFTGLLNVEDKEEMKNKLSSLYNVSSIFDFNFGRSAIQIALKSLNLNRGDEVILSTYSCRGVIEPIIKEGLIPVFVDIDSNYNINPESIKKHLTNKTRVVIMTHLFGRPAQIEKIQKIVKKHKLYLIDDAAQVVGLKHKNKMVGTFGDFGILSFGIGKSISATGGGILLTNNEEFAKRIIHYWILKGDENKKIKRRIINYLLKYKHRRLTAPFYLLIGRLGKPLEYEIKRMSLVDCSIIKKQLSRLDGIIEERKKIAEYYDKHLKNVRKGNSEDIYTKYLFVSKENNIHEFADYLRLKGIEVEFNYKPLHLNSQYSIYWRDRLSNAENMWEKNISIPCHPRVNARKMKYVVDTINNYNHG